jgi:AcrR family transcriptional regulator
MSEAPRRVGRPARVSREQVVQAAISLANDGGLDAVTMRRLGEQVGLEAMSLYRHVRNRDDVLDAMTDVVFGEIAVPVDEPDWRMAMRVRAASMRDALRRHPWAVGLLESRSQAGPANLRHHDAVLGVLERAGFSARSAMRAYNLLDSYIYGFAIQERTMAVATPEAMAEIGGEIVARMPADALPYLSALGRELFKSGFDYADEFAFGLDVILDGLMAARTRASGSSVRRRHRRA